MSQSNKKNAKRSKKKQSVFEDQQPTLVKVVELDSEQNYQLTDIVEEMTSTANSILDPHHAKHDWLGKRASDLAPLVFGLRHRRELTSHLRNGGLIVFKNLPKLEHQEDSCEQHITPHQSLAAMVTSFTSTPFGYLQEDEGRLFQRLRPKPGLEDSNSGCNRKRLMFHADNLFLKSFAQPETITLVCRHNQAMACTELLTGRKIRELVLANFGQNVVRVLESPRFRMNVSDSFSNSLKKVWTRDRAIFMQDGRIVGKAYDMKPAVASDEMAAIALNAFQQTIENAQPCVRYTLQPSEALTFNQQVNLHGRSAIGQDGRRELVRGYGRLNFQGLAETNAILPDSKIFDAIPLIDRQQDLRISAANDVLNRNLPPKG